MRHRTHARYGWLPDLPDARDQWFAAPPVTEALPHSVDLRAQCPPVYDQGQLGSCTANAIGGAVQFEWRKQSMPDEVPSRLFIYYCEREIEGTVSSDSGAMLRDGIKSVATYGAPYEAAWPYDPHTFAVKPPPSVWTSASRDKAVKYARVMQVGTQLKGCLAAGYPFVFGFTVYDSFESDEVATTGMVPMPSGDDSVLGGHAVLCVGYDDSQQRFIVRNSWGDGWGLQGYCLMPYGYLTDPLLASDMWTIRLMEAPQTP